MVAICKVSFCEGKIVSENRVKFVCSQGVSSPRF